MIGFLVHPFPVLVRLNQSVQIQSRTDNNPPIALIGRSGGFRDPLAKSVNHCTFFPPSPADCFLYTTLLLHLYYHHCHRLPRLLYSRTRVALSLPTPSCCDQQFPFEAIIGTLCAHCVTLHVDLIEARFPQHQSRYLHHKPSWQLDRFPRGSIL